VIAIQAPIIDVRHGVTMTSGGAEAVAASAPAWAGDRATAGEGDDRSIPTSPTSSSDDVE